MSDPRSTYSIQTAVLSLQEELERLKIQAVMGWPKEFRSLEWYGLKNGMRVLEVGSGPVTLQSNY
ncbi:protein-L-isoaspartate O-methyltransferase [Paenibacillus polymyxa]|uniref:protein-L-isoaspartate O-methyltransferase n=1 Tax=Paenibacillus polymyxa TaxID=1406 RepID=UPI0020357A0A|nr:protein-L-isoaspartate O-methyltransferase [Paenibacillus polymyxa]